MSEFDNSKSLNRKLTINRLQLNRSEAQPYDEPNEQVFHRAAQGITDEDKHCSKTKRFCTGWREYASVQRPYADSNTDSERIRPFEGECRLRITKPTRCTQRSRRETIVFRPAWTSKSWSRSCQKFNCPFRRLKWDSQILSQRASHRASLAQVSNAIRNS